MADTLSPADIDAELKRRAAASAVQPQIPASPNDPSLNIDDLNSAFQRNGIQPLPANTQINTSTPSDGNTIANIVAGKLGVRPPSQPSFGDQLTRQLGLTGRYLVEGGMALPNIVGDAANGLVNVATGTVNKLAGTHIPAMRPTSQVTSELLDYAGLPKPQTTIEKVVAEPSKMVASIPAYAAVAPVTGIKELSPLAENLKAQLFGATGAGTGLGISKQYTDNPVYQMAASLLGGVGGAAISNATDRIAQAAQGTKLLPTTQDLKDQASAAYKAADDAGLVIKPQAVQNLTSDIQQNLADFGYHPNLQPRIATVLGELNRISQPAVDDAGNQIGQNITTKEVQVLRRMANNARLSSDPSEQTLGKMVVDKLDGFMQGLQPADVLQGNAQDAADNVQQGAQFWKQYRKAQQIETAGDNADLRAASAGSGGNVENATRQAIKNILLNPKQRAGYTPDELDQMEKIVRGGTLQNAMRLLGKLSPQGNGLGMAGGAASATAALMSGNPWLAVPSALGLAAKPIATNMAKGNVTDLLNLIRAGGTQAGLEAAQNPSYLQPSNLVESSGAYPLLLQLLQKGNEVAQPSLGLLRGASSQANTGQPIGTQR